MGLSCNKLQRNYRGLIVCFEGNEAPFLFSLFSKKRFFFHHTLCNRSRCRFVINSFALSNFNYFFPVAGFLDNHFASGFDALRAWLLRIKFLPGKGLNQTCFSTAVFSHYIYSKERARGCAVSKSGQVNTHSLSSLRKYLVRN